MKISSVSCPFKNTECAAVTLKKDKNGRELHQLNGWKGTTREKPSFTSPNRAAKAASTEKSGRARAAISEQTWVQHKGKRRKGKITKQTKKSHCNTAQNYTGNKKKRIFILQRQRKNDWGTVKKTISGCHQCSTGMPQCPTTLDWTSTATARIRPSVTEKKRTDNKIWRN